MTWVPWRRNFMIELGGLNGCYLPHSKCMMWFSLNKNIGNLSVITIITTESWFPYDLKRL